MSSQSVFYLKYRPKSLTDLIGQIEVKNALNASFKNNKLSHGYLFVGPRGTGKTSTARILAKMVNCEGKEGEVPCNSCNMCLSITDGSNLDLIEIDAASNRGIEDIRALREKIKLSPTGAKKKVYIIDEVHMLTTEAFNALLKTLEEPPSHAMFILATTDAEKIPQTILSRVQRLNFKLATPDQLMEALQKIVKEEKIEIDEEALKILIKKSDGSFRDGVKLLDQVSAMEGKITREALEESLKFSQFEDLLDLIKNLMEKDINQGLLNIHKQIENGIDIKHLTLSLMDILRSVMFIKNGLGEQLVKSNLMEEKYQELVKISEKMVIKQSFSMNKDLIRTLDILQSSLEKLKTASIASLPLEIAVVEICGENEIATLPIVARNDNKNQPEILSQVQNDEITSDDNSPDIQKLKEKWTYVLETIRPVNFSLEALLRSINISDCTETDVFIEVPYSFHQRILEAPKNRDLLEGILSEILGRSVRVSAVLGNRPQRKEDIVNIEMAADDEIIRAAAEIFNSDTIN